MIRAFLLATATVARLKPRRARTSWAKRLMGSCLFGAVRTTARAPWTRSVRRRMSPRLVMPSIRCRSPRVLTRDEPEPGGKMPAVLEFGAVPDCGDDSSRRLGPDALDLGNPLAGLRGAKDALKLGVEPAIRSSRSWKRSQSSPIVSRAMGVSA